MQLGTWRAVAGGEHALVVAPTGSGKTLAAFLHAIDRLSTERLATAERPPTEHPAAVQSAAAQSTQRPPTARNAADAPARAGTRVLYVSPVKALAADVRKNLEAPLAGIAARQAERDQSDTSRTAASGGAVSVGMRTGDTTPAERARLVRTPPDILVTTPESLFLMLTSRARDTLHHVDTVIVDEVHAVAGTKRGSHLALSLERLDDLLDEPARRIGLSATVSPIDTVAEFLGGAAPVTVVHPEAGRVPDMRIVVPVPDLGDIAGAGTGAGAGLHTAHDASISSPTSSVGHADATSPASPAGDERTGSIWPHIEASVLDTVLAHRSTIVFVNSRGLAEKLTARLNGLHAERLDSPHPEVLHSAAGPTTNRSAHPQGYAVASDEPLVIARSHHGSVSKEQRKLVEDDLKSGSLRCVVATSSLELGIDMGDVDLVIQIAAPPDVASGLQRVGRANHQVGATASGLVYPRTRRDLLESAVVVDRMERSLLEPLAPPANPLDVLAQHTVSATALEDVALDAWWTTVRRAHPFRNLSRATFESVIGMLAGRWSSEAFTDLRPRLVWDRDTDILTARSGAQRLATTNAGTIPDRGAFSVVLREGAEAAGARRVGELDEEMVHESRVGDVITLGAGSWLVQEISTDRVTVVPAPGRSARLPFWHGEGPGRPAALGEAIGAYVRGIAGHLPPPASGPEAGTGLPSAPDEAGVRDPAGDRVASNLRAFISAQRDATGVVPCDTDLVLEVCPEETGDLRLVLHSPYGRRVHAPWALAIDERLRERFGGSAAVMAADDGIIARIPAEVADGADLDPALLAFDPDVLSQRVERLVGGSALFAARFRECAARALLLPRRDPGRRTPLWQQRLRAGRLLEAVAEFPDFPILLETARECLEDIYDIAGLRRLMAGVHDGSIRVHVAHTAVPSPFAGDLLFGYVGEFLYEGDRPLAERRASVLSLDTAVLADLVGRDDAAELLDPALIAEVEAELQRTLPGRRARGREGVADLLRELGPLTAAEVVARSEDTAVADDAVTAQSEDPAAAGDESVEALEELAAAGRAVVAARGAAVPPLWAAVEDAGRLRAVMGASAVRPGSPDRTVPDECLDPGSDPLRDLVVRCARTRGAVTAEDLAERFAVGEALIRPLLEKLDAEGTLIATTTGWIHTDVFARVRRRALQDARAATRPVPARAYALLLAERHALGGRRHGTTGLVRALEQLSGAALPASLWESQILPARVGDGSPHLLDDLLASRDVLWMPVDESADRAPDPVIALHLAELADESLQEADESPLSDLQRAIFDILTSGGAWTAEEISARAAERMPTPDELRTALWGLARRGLVTTDSFAPVRGALEAATGEGLGGRRRGLGVRGSGGGTGRHVGGRSGRTRGSGRRRLRTDAWDSARFGTSHGSAYRSLEPVAAEPPDPRVQGRWSAVSVERMGQTERALGMVETLLDRYGVVSRDAAVAEAVPGGFSVVHRICTSLEDAGHVVRGRFVEGLGGAQFAEPATVDRLRDLVSPAAGSASQRSEPIVVSAADPANPYGRMLPWPRGAGATVGPAEAGGTAGTGGRVATGEADGLVRTAGDAAPRSSRSSGHSRPSRTAGALVVLHDGEVRAWLSRGGRALLTFASEVSSNEEAPRQTETPPRTEAASRTEAPSRAEALSYAEALVAFLRRSGAADSTVETIDGVSTRLHPWATALQDAGLSVTPRGLRFYGRP